MGAVPSLSSLVYDCHRQPSCIILRDSLHRTDRGAARNDNTLVQAINGWIDGLATAESDALPGPLGRWYGNVEVHSYYGKGARPVDDGANLQHLYEAGPDNGGAVVLDCHRLPSALP
jgi:hypothetical protein